MAIPFTEDYLQSVQKQFAYYKMLGEKTFDQIGPNGFFWQPATDANSIAIIVNHLAGNMLSRWTNFLSEDGEKSWRHRDGEFEDQLGTEEAVRRRWEEGWACLFEALASIRPESFDQLVYIRNQGHSITEAVNRQVAHYAYHVGQIVLLGKILLGEKWESLSIPKGKSQAFNKEKFGKEKKQRHFTDDFLEKGGNKS